MQLNKDSYLSEIKVPDLHYKLENFEEIFRTGYELWEEYETGVRSFAMLSTGYQTSQQKALMGIACFFDLKKRNPFQKVAIITHHMKHGLFSSFIEQCEGEGPIYSFHQHFDFIDFAFLLETYRDENNLKEFLAQYAIILWDMPELNLIEKYSKAYEPFLRQMEFLCILSAKAKNKAEEHEHIAAYFRDYGLRFGELVTSKSEIRGRSIFDRLKSFSSIFN